MASPSYIGSRLEQAGSRLMALSMWCLGKDVVFENGNLLLKSGFERIAKPEGHPGTSQYVLTLNANTSLHLWGFGVLISQRAGFNVFLDRDLLRPRIVGRHTAFSDTFEMATLGHIRLATDAFDFASTRAALLQWVDWMLSYEQWVEANVSPHHRTQMLEMKRPHHTPADHSLKTLWAWWKADFLSSQTVA